MSDNCENKKKKISYFNASQTYIETFSYKAFSFFLLLKEQILQSVSDKEILKQWFHYLTWLFFMEYLGYVFLDFSELIKCLWLPELSLSTWVWDLYLPLARYLGVCRPLNLTMSNFVLFLQVILVTHSVTQIKKQLSSFLHPQCPNSESCHFFSVPPSLHPIQQSLDLDPHCFCPTLDSRMVSLIPIWLL